MQKLIFTISILVFSFTFATSLEASNFENLSQSKKELRATLIKKTFGAEYALHSRRLDIETGNYYYRHRYYSPQTGEYLTIDPSGNWNHGQGNGFSAFGEDGCNNSDPYGLGPCSPAGSGKTRWRTENCTTGCGREGIMLCMDRLVCVKNFFTEGNSWVMTVIDCSECKEY